MKKNTVKKKTCKHLWYPLGKETLYYFETEDSNSAGGGGNGISSYEKTVVFCQRCLKKEAI